MGLDLLFPPRGPSSWVSPVEYSKSRLSSRPVRSLFLSDLVCHFPRCIRNTHPVDCNSQNPIHNNMAIISHLIPARSLYRALPAPARPLRSPPHSAYPLSAAPSSTMHYGSDPTGTIGVHHPKEVVRIERDWTGPAGGGVVQFQTGWVMELEGRVSFCRDRRSDCPARTSCGAVSSWILRKSKSYSRLHGLVHLPSPPLPFSHPGHPNAIPSSNQYHQPTPPIRSIHLVHGLGKHSGRLDVVYEFELVYPSV